MYNAHLPVAYTISLYNQPELNNNKTNFHFAEIFCLAEQILVAIAKFIRGKSGLVLAKIHFVNLNVARFAPIFGSDLSPLPKSLQSKKAVLNIQNKDDQCFGYSIPAALHPPENTSNKNRTKLNLQYFQQHGLNEIDYPVSPLDILQLEERLNLSNNVFSYFDDIGKTCHPMFISRRNARLKINLLYFTGHYAWIKNIS